MSATTTGTMPVLGNAGFVRKAKKMIASRPSEGMACPALPRPMSAGASRRVAGLVATMPRGTARISTKNVESNVSSTWRRVSLMMASNDSSRVSMASSSWPPTHSASPPTTISRNTGIAA